MLLSLFATCAIALAVATILLLLFGHRVRFSSRIFGMLLTLAVVAFAGEAASALLEIPSSYVQGAQIVLIFIGWTIVLLRPRWNGFGQVFYGALLSATFTYLAFGIYMTFFTRLSGPATAASLALLLIEGFALMLATYFAFDNCDAVCRTRMKRRLPELDPSYTPFVSLQIPAYNEPADMLIETIKSVEAIDYPNFEVVVIDTNTEDRSAWQPVEDYCRGRERVKFIHADDVAGFKAGALNHLMRERLIDDRTELIGLIDADYIVKPDFLKSVVGYFADDRLAFLQTPQNYRGHEGNAYLTALYDSYRYFFKTAMPSRNDRNSIIFAGTMGLLRRRVLEELGGWDENIITEDADTSLRMLKAGYEGLYIDKAFGAGMMPLSFGALKTQQYRWCFGSIQILKKHRKHLMPWNRDPENRLTTAQRLDYLFGQGLQWMTHLVNVAFSALLLATGYLLFSTHKLALRPLLGAAGLLPAVIIGSGLLRAMWALRVRTGITIRRAVMAFMVWLSVSWTLALACVQALIRRRGVFMRTPKTSERRTIIDAFRAAKMETLLAVTLWGAGVAAATRAGRQGWLILALFAWQGSLYASSPIMSWLNVRMDLSDPLERRRLNEWRRDRFARRMPYYAGAFVGLAGAAVLIALLVFGGTNPGPAPKDPFALPKRSANDQGPLGNIIRGSPAPIEFSPAPFETGTSSPTAAPTTSPTSRESTPTTEPSEEPTPTVTPTSTALP